MVCACVVLVCAGMRCVDTTEVIWFSRGPLFCVPLFCVLRLRVYREQAYVGTLAHLQHPQAKKAAGADLAACIECVAQATVLLATGRLWAALCLDKQAVEWRAAVCFVYVWVV